MKSTGKTLIKKILGQIPFSAELYWLVRQQGKQLNSRFSLKRLNSELPGMLDQARMISQSATPGKNIFIFGTLHYWIEHVTLLGVALAALGHRVTVGFLPYSDWQKSITRFDLLRQNVYAKKVLSQAEPFIDIVSLLETRTSYKPFPQNVKEAVDEVTSYDTQYTLQVEEVDQSSEIYKMRLERNQLAAQAALRIFGLQKPDVVIVPNGTIQELGVIYRVARCLNIPAVTYEFGDQRERIWLAQNAEVMRQDTDDLWKARKGRYLTKAQMERLKHLFDARQIGAAWENFARRWQSTPSQGGDQVRSDLKLDHRPVVLLATNVLGDSLTLGRQLFSHSMAEWIERTVQYFSGRDDVQLLIRVHPGEVLTHGTSMEQVIHQVLPKLPEHIHVISPKEKINTYDLVNVADVGLVYTTTVGLEMAMNGLPVIVSGQTHYRQRGFTYDPDSWVSYYKILGQILEKPKSFALKNPQVDLAWEYAYRFFFEYPRPFPWHLVKLWEDYQECPLSKALGSEGLEKYAETFRYLAGEPIDWKSVEV